MEQRDYLHAGLVPPTKCTTLGDVLNSYVDDKKRSLDIGDIVARTYNEYLQVCDVIATLGKHRPIESITTDDLGRLRTMLAKGKGGKLVSPLTHKRLLTFARMVFHHANEELGFAVRYKKPLRTPPKAKIRERRNEIGARMFEAAEIRKLIKSADQPLKAMILLGINCGFGPSDCILLPVKALDIANGWHNFARPKTQVARRCALWPETVKALREVVPNNGPMFNGRTWSRHIIARQFKELAEQCGVYQEHTKTFYSLRRTFETIAKTAEVNQSVIDRIMGHERPDMSEVYNQMTFDSMLRKCTDHVRKWLRGSISLR
jgi:integrase